MSIVVVYRPTDICAIHPIEMSGQRKVGGGF